MRFFKRKPELSDGYVNHGINASTIMLLEAIDGMPAQNVCPVISSALRDKQGVTHTQMRMLAQDLDREADARERNLR